MKNQTAITWLLKELAKKMNFVPMVHWHSIGQLIEEAKELEKQQIIDAYNNGEDRSAELYYNETYNQ